MKLKVYDFDDTLAVSSGIIKLHRDGEERVYLSNEFVEYSPIRGDLLCFSDLNHLTRVRLVLHNWEELVADSKCDRTDVLILTSRPPGAASAISKLLGRFGVEVTKVHAIGSGKPEDKVSVIRETLRSGIYRYVRFVDDNPKMVNAVESYLRNHWEGEWSSSLHSHDMLKSDSLSEDLGDFHSDHYEEWKQAVE